MHPERIQSQAMARFKCLGADCPDTCCRGWGMQVMAPTVEKYEKEAPELLESVVAADGGFVMKRDPVDDYCVKLDHGLCSIHRDYGEDFLGDACRFFPRITRALGALVVTTGALSCPEAARLMLTEADGIDFTERTDIHTPFTLRNYLPPELSEEQAFQLHRVFLAVAADTAHTAEHAIMRISATARALEMQPVAVWPDAVGMYLEFAEGRIPSAEPSAVDPFNLLQALHGLFVASHSQHQPLREHIARTADLLGVAFDAGGAMMLADDALERCLKLMARAREDAEVMQPLLRRYLGAQLAQALFPFAGLGDTLSQRVTIIGVRLATLKLLLASLPVAAGEAEIIGVIQSLSRFMDHLADGELSLRIYAETGWTREPRLRALVGG